MMHQSDNWSAVKADTQFMTKGSSHELAVLLLTEAVRYATVTLKSPLWAILLNKEATFDSALKEHIIPAACNAMATGSSVVDQSLVGLLNRLSNRFTYLQYDKDLMGPIKDEAGVEQGGIPSGEEFQLMTNFELDALNTCGLGFDMGCGPVGGIGAADDEVLLSGSHHSLQSLLNLAEKFCYDCSMKLVPSKTHLILFTPKHWNDLKCWK